MLPESSSRNSKGNGLVPWMTRLVAAEMGIRKIPAGLRGAVLFDNSLVSTHDTIFTAQNGRITSWDIFRRYWVHRWAADRLWQQLGINVCKTLLDSFDDAVDSTHHPKESSSTRDPNELKVAWKEFHRLLATDVFLAGHPLRDLLLDSAEPEDPTEEKISWGMYMHAVVFQLHEAHRHQKEHVRTTASGDGENVVGRGGFSSGESSGGDSTDSDGEDFEEEVEEVEKNQNTVLVKGSGSIAGRGGVALSLPKQSSPSSPNPNHPVRPNIKGSGAQHGNQRGRRSKRHILIHRLASKQRYLRNMELELQQQDDAAARSSPFKRKGNNIEEGARERLRGRVHHLRRQVAKLNQKVGELTGGKHQLVTVSSGISLVEEATRVARLEDARSLRRQHLQNRVAQNKIHLAREVERKRRQVEKKAKQKTSKVQRPASAGPSGRRATARRQQMRVPRERKRLGGRTHTTGRRPVSAGVTRRVKTRMSQRRVGNDSSPFLSNKKPVGNGKSKSKRRARRPEDDDEALDARMHDFGMPGYGTSRAWQELKRFFAERVRLNKKEAKKEDSLRQKKLWKRESEHMDRVTRRRNARQRSSHVRLVTSQKKSYQAQSEKKARIEVEILRQSEEFQRQHQEDMSWIQSAQFSPRARSVAYDSMRKLTMSPPVAPNVTETYRGNGNGNGNFVIAHAHDHTKKRPGSANPRLRNNDKKSLPPRPPSAPNTRRATGRFGMGHSSRESHVVPGPAPIRPSTSKPMFNSGPRAGRGAKHFHLVAELEDAKALLDSIKADQEVKCHRIGSTVRGANKNDNKKQKEGERVVAVENENRVAEPATTTTKGGGSSSSGGGSGSGGGGGSSGSSGSSSSSSSNDQGSIVNAAIIQAVQLQMLRQWPQKKMSLRVRKLVHGQLRGRAQRKAKNIELDHATQRLNDKASTKKKLVDTLELSLPSHSATTPLIKKIKFEEGSQSPFVHNIQTGASPLIKFRRMTSTVQI